jgi:hypothetical protein
LREGIPGEEKVRGNMDNDGEESKSRWSGRRG